LDAQHAAITAEATRRGWTLVDIATDAGASGKSLAGRPALAAALTALDNGEAAALVVAKVDRLSRSLADFAALMQRAERSGWKVVTLDLPIDTTAPAGELMAAVVAATAQYERRLIGVRTRDALAARRAAGVKLGRPRLLDATVAERIRAARLEGATLQAIADELNGEGTLTATGKQWSPALVRKVALQEPVSNAEDAA
jgi:DNA invertase Pin-like site-specific DNA recombinase